MGGKNILFPSLGSDWGGETAGDTFHAEFYEDWQAQDFEERPQARCQEKEGRAWESFWTGDTIPT